MYIRHLLARGKFFLIIVLLLASNSRHASSILMLLLLLPLLLARHVVATFADWRARLTPNFRRVHAVVAAVATFVLSLSCQPCSRDSRTGP